MAAEKKIPLSIVLSLVDRVTARINAVNKRLDAINKPAKDFGKAVQDLGEKSGLGTVVDGFKGVGSAIGDLLGKVAMIGGVAAAAVMGLKSIVDEFDDMGDMADRLGVNVDFLAQMRFAAERSGATVQDLDQGLQTLTENIGGARAGMGRMVKALGNMSPALLEQLKASKDTEQAFGLVAHALAKLPDQARRARLAMATLGNSALVPLLARDTQGIMELRGEFAATAGSLDEAAGKAGAVDDSFKNLHAATLGVKAALLEGLAPAMGEIVDDLKKWLVDHREDIKKWAVDIGKKLPDAVHAIVDAVQGAVKTVGDFVDMIGGWKVAAVAVAAVIAGPLIASVISLGIAIMTTPVGWIMAAIAAIAAAIYIVVTKWNDASTKWKIIVDAILFFMLPFISWPLIIYRHWDGIKAFFVKLWDGVKDVFSAAWDWISGIVEKVVDAVDTVVDAGSKLFSAIPGLPGQPAPLPGGGGFGDVPRPTVSAAVLEAASGLQRQAGAGGETKITVDFMNAPRGTRASVDPSTSSSVNVDLAMGYQLGWAP